MYLSTFYSSIRQRCHLFISGGTENGELNLKAPIFLNDPHLGVILAYILYWDMGDTHPK